MTYISVLIVIFLVVNAIILVPLGIKWIKAKQDWNQIKNNALQNNSSESKVAYDLAWALASADKNKTMKQLYLLLSVLSSINLFYIIKTGMADAQDNFYLAIGIGLTVTLWTAYNSYQAGKQEVQDKTSINEKSAELGLNGDVTISKIVNL